jgi:putative endonuclease
MIMPACIYILTDPTNTFLYPGLTYDLTKRIREHKNKMHQQSFTSKFNCNKLIYYKYLMHIEEAMKEKQRIDSLSRAEKIKLITAFNPDWKDLYDHELSK